MGYVYKIVFTLKTQGVVMLFVSGLCFDSKTNDCCLCQYDQGTFY